MRDYAKIAPQFWIGETGRQLRRLGAETQVAALYLITSPHANMLGLYYLPLPLFAHETGLSIEGASKGLRSLSEVGFAYYDEASEMVWVPQMARFQLGEALDPKDKRVIGINKEYQTLPNNRFLSDFYRKYHVVYHLQKPRGFEGASMGVRSQEQDLEQELEQDLEQNLSPLTPQGATVEVTATQRGSGQKVKPARSPKSSRRCPGNYVPSEAVERWAAEEFSEVDFHEALAEMRDHQFKDGRTDWDATLRNWIREKHRREGIPIHRQRASPTHQSSSTVRDAKTIDAVRDWNAMKNGTTEEDTEDAYEPHGPRPLLSGPR